MRLSHAAARKYALIMSIRLLVATDPDHGKMHAVSSYLQVSAVPYCMSVARFFNLLGTRGQKRWLRRRRPFCHSVCLANGEVHGIRLRTSLENGHVSVRYPA